MSPRLQMAIEGVYSAFKTIPKPKIIHGCPCCIDGKRIDVLLSKPLRELSPDDLTKYASSVFLTVGSSTDYFYLLPRILEICATTHGWWPDPEVICSSLDNSAFQEWPEPQKQAVMKFLDEMIQDLLVTDNSGYDISSWLCGLARVKLDLQPYLDQIAANKSRLIEFYEANCPGITNGRLPNGFWTDIPAERDLVVKWFNSPQIKRAIESSYGLA